MKRIGLSLKSSIARERALSYTVLFDYQMLIFLYFLFQGSLLANFKQLNSITLSRNKFGNFPSGPPKQLETVTVRAKIES